MAKAPFQKDSMVLNVDKSNFTPLTHSRQNGLELQEETDEPTIAAETLHSPQEQMPGLGRWLSGQHTSMRI